MAQWLSIFFVLPENLGSIYSTHRIANSYLKTPVPGNVVFASGLFGNLARMWFTETHEVKTSLAGGTHL